MRFRTLKISLIFFILSANLFSDQTLPQPQTWLLNIEGVINPISARYLKGQLSDAHHGARPDAIILELNTPGGLESSMRAMVQEILNSSIPIIVYVSPRGARAASAGMFLTISAHIAAMAPGTNIGAAHPVSLGSENESSKQGSVMKSKVVNDAAALARAIAHDRKRNIQWVESSVRESKSITAEEALQKNVIDIIASNREELMQKLHQRTVTTSFGKILLNTKNTVLVQKPMSFAEKAVQTITDPNIAYILVTIGTVGIIAELYSPGLIFPGVIGATSLILAFTAFGSLPVNWAGVILLVASILLLFFELQAEGFGFLGLAAVGTFVLGSLILYRPWSESSPSLPRVQVSPLLLGGLTLFLLGLVTLIMRLAIRVRRLPIATGPQSLIGSQGRVTHSLTPFGRVKVQGEEWSAELAHTPDESKMISVGEIVEVVAVDGVTLQVKKKN